MALWLVFAVMTAVAMGAALLPLVLRSNTVAVAGENDAAVYRDQLDEVERDRADGTIGGAEAEAARIEVSRRLIAAAQRAATEPTSTAPAWWRRRGVAIAALVVLQVGAGGLYYLLGSPTLAGEPLASRTTTAHGGDRSIEAMFAKVEAHLAEHPDDGRGWEVIAPVYMRLGRYDDAAKARANAIKVLGATAQRVADYGEALVSAANGVVTAEAKTAFDEAIRLDPSDVAARFYQGLAAEQDGNRDQAGRIWRALLAEAPEGAQWPEFVRRALARLDAPVAGPGQNPMIREMVDRLAARLRQDGSDVDGWIQLVRSYKVLEDPQRAGTAVADARQALTGDADKLRRLEEGLKSIEAGAAVAASTPAPGAPDDAPPAPGQDQMIRGMVDRLAARLRQDGSDVEGWLRLVRSYQVLGNAEQARAAVADARRALAADPDKLHRLDDGIKELGVGG